MNTSTPAKQAAKKAAKKKVTPKPLTTEERVAQLEERHHALLQQLKLHGIHLDLGEDAEDEEIELEPVDLENED